MVSTLALFTDQQSLLDEPLRHTGVHVGLIKVIVVKRFLSIYE